MAAAAVAFAACSSDELASVEQQPAARGMKPVEFATAVNHQTRAGQIEALTTYWVQTTGTFYRANGVGLTDPLLTVGSDGSYKVNDDAEASRLYWPVGGTDKYAWIALPLPADFTGFTAHKKYVFTLNFRNDAMGLVDKDQNPNDDGDPTTDDTPSGPDTNDEIDDDVPGGGITLPEHSGIPLEVTVDEVLDFDEEGEFDVNEAAPAWDGDLATLKEDVTVTDGMTLFGTLGANEKVSIADGATVTLAGASINADGTWTTGYYAGITCLGDATIILKDGTENTVVGFYSRYPGFYAAEGHTLTIKGGAEGTGSLLVGSYGGAGIGGGYEINCGNIDIQGGVIQAYGGSNSAGIGCSQFSICGNITISGGTIETYGDVEGAGIGSCYEASCGDITITSGVTSVTAKKDDDDYSNKSIGAGYQGSCGTVTIGGTVYWNGSEYLNGGDTYLATSPLIYEP